MRDTGRNRPRTGHRQLAFSTLAVALLSIQTLEGQVRLNELVAANRSTLEDPDEAGAFEDWIELVNLGPGPEVLSGLYLSDDPEDPTRWQIPPGVRLDAGARLVLFADNDPEQGPLHASFQLASGGEELSLYASDGTTLLDSIQFGPLGEDQALGRFPDGDGPWVIQTPSPGAVNVRGQAGAVNFSRDGGVFVDSVDVELSTQSETARIYYTLDKSEPTPEQGLLYTAPIRIETTTWVRARAVTDGLEAGPVDSRVYIGVDAEVAAFDSNLPLVFIDSFGVRIDATSNPDAPRPYRAVSMVVVDSDTESGRANSLGTPNFAGHAGMRVRGQSTSNYDKKSYNIETWDEDDQDRDVSLLGFPSESDWVLHGPFSDKTLMRNFLAFRWWNRLDRYAPRTRYVEAFVNFTAGENISQADYRGVYILMEKIKRDDNRLNIARLDPGDTEEPELTGGYLLRRDWFGGKPASHKLITETYRDTLLFEDPKPDEITPQQRRFITDYVNEMEEALVSEGFADPETGYERYLDVVSFIDYAIFMEISRNVDAYVLSAFLSKDRGGKLAMGPVWDFNGSLGGANYFCSCQTEGWHYEFNERECPECSEGGGTFPADNVNGYRWWARLQEDPAYNRRFSDRWGELRESVLSDTAITADIDELFDTLTDGGAEDNPARRNFDRWRILNRYIWPNFFVGGTYADQVEFLREWVLDRVSWMDEATTVPPALSHPGGRVDRGLEVHLSVPEGEIFYTLDGPDPRADDGSPAVEAVLYDGTPILITQNHRLQTRAMVSDGLWSELVEAVYVTDAPPIVITEVMFDPPKREEDSHSVISSYEFIEFQNIGDAPVDITGLRLLRASGTTTRFDFSETSIPTLDPGAHIVAVRNEEAFVNRYGSAVPVAGIFRGTLRNTADTLLLVGPLGETLQEFTYDADWYPETNGNGASLVIRDPRGPLDLWTVASGWRPSLESGGSPGRGDGDVGAAGAVLPGDLNEDRRLSVLDALELLRFLSGETALPCDSASGRNVLANLNGDGSVDISDAVFLLHHIFQRGQAPVGGKECVLAEGCSDTCDG